MTSDSRSVPRTTRPRGCRRGYSAWSRSSGAFPGVPFRTVRESELPWLPDYEQDHVLAPIQLLLELARRDALIPVLLQGLALGLVVVVHDKAARGGSVELLDDGLMLGVFEVSS
jgi:hypothetical protein